MFSTCLFCHASLGTNQSIEHFPVGKRLAFDSERGRLWAVCPKCARWNLTPLEERWEALEECERAYRDTRKRVSTDNIALARLPDGTDLIRIGQPQRPEFAAWRYERVVRQRRRKLLRSTLSASAISLAVVLPVMLFSTSSLLFLPGQAGLIAWQRYALWRRHMRIALDDGHFADLTQRQLLATQCRLSDVGELEVALNHGGRRKGLQIDLVDSQRLHLHGVAAKEALRRIIVGVNLEGASKIGVRDAVAVVESAIDRSDHGSYMSGEHASGGLAQILSEPEHAKRSESRHWVIREFHARHRLALEMVLHEDDERRAMSGELGALYARWEEAERIAKISDGALSRLSAESDSDRDPSNPR